MLAGCSYGLLGHHGSLLRKSGTPAGCVSVILTPSLLFPDGGELCGEGQVALLGWPGSRECCAQHVVPSIGPSKRGSRQAHHLVGQVRRHAHLQTRCRFRVTRAMRCGRWKCSLSPRKPYYQQVMAK